MITHSAEVPIAAECVDTYRADGIAPNTLRVAVRTTDDQTRTSPPSAKL